MMVMIEAGVSGLGFRTIRVCLLLLVGVCHGAAHAAVLHPSLREGGSVAPTPEQTLNPKP